MKPSTELQPLIAALLARYDSSDEGLMAAIDLAVLVAQADGKIDAAERAALIASIEALMGTVVAPVITSHLVRESRDKIAEIGPETRAVQIGSSLKAHNAIDEGLRLALAIAHTSDGLSAEERARIAVVAKAAGVPESHIDELA